MESSGIGDELQVGCRCQVLVGSWYRGVLPGRDRRYRLREGVVERWIWVLGAAPVPGPPAGVDRELHEIGQPHLGLIGTCGLAARQGAETLKADRCAAVRREVVVDEVKVGELILGVVVDVLRHVGVQLLQRSGISLAATAARDLVVLDAAELVVLLPEVGLEDLKRREESENRGVALGQRPTRSRRYGGQQAGSCCPSADSQACAQEGAAAEEMP